MEDKLQAIKAIIEWTEHGLVLKVNERIDLPPRTALDLAFPVPRVPKAPGVIEETTVFIRGYRCLDCAFATQSLENMRAHQRSGPHSLMWRIKRWLGWNGSK
ncbi:hypothetical protein LCGC14_0262250 [marine sediment metagenome]|uniref:C2H2-type domain-containing protein n=1 Tax=marine sediment metagenome TaxID=412755 RepID=A0A0F9WLN6_9ZZZZ